MLFEIIKTALKLMFGKGSVRSFSQFGEDIVVGSLLRQKNGIYVDVGAFHPTLYSNTYLLYRRGWRGVVVDPTPNARTLFKVFRPKDSFYSVGIGNTSHALYHLFADPAYNTFDETQAKLWQAKGVTLTGTREVNMRPLKDILQEEKISSIDVLSVDVEGLDIQVLATHDWTIPTHVIIVEDHGFQVAQKERSECYRFLSEKGYVLKALCGPSLIFEKG
jgi:FkbM family methyltransferase